MNHMARRGVFQAKKDCPQTWCCKDKTKKSQFQNPGADRKAIHGRGQKDTLGIVNYFFYFCNNRKIMNLNAEVS